MTSIRRATQVLARTLSLGVLLGAAFQAQALTVQFGSRAALAGTDTLTWGQLGPDITFGITSPSAVTTTGLASATVSNPGGDMIRADEGGLMSGYKGSFAVGAQLLGTIDNAGPLTISFANPVARVGAQIQSLEYGTFTGWLSAYDAGNSLLGTVSVGGLSGDLQTNTAPFLGIGSSAVNIKSVSFSVTGTPNDYLMINTVDLSQQVVLAPIPEPQAYVLALAGMLVLGVAARRRQGASRKA
ncbi:MAG: hypothetical protein JNJ71_15265 [Rubrivivax sp.]|nr:hypothetical protein [Rubrivivax sp.]